MTKQHQCIAAIISLALKRHTFFALKCSGLPVGKKSFLPKISAAHLLADQKYTQP